MKSIVQKKRRPKRSGRAEMLVRSGRAWYQDWCFAKACFSLEYMVGFFLDQEPIVTFQTGEKGSLVPTSVSLVLCISC